MPDEPLTVLVLGRSSTEGLGLDDIRKSWPVLMGELVAAELDRPVNVETRRLNPDGRDPTGYIERLIAETRPHAVLVSVSAYDFAVGRVVNRVSQVFGVRVARAASEIENRTRALQKSSRPGLVNRSARKVVTRFIGTAPMRTREEVEYTLEGVFRCLSRQEDIAVAVRETSGSGSRVLAERNPGYARISADFTAEWERRARKRHFYWIPAPADRPEAAYARDGVHLTELGHEIRAKSIAPTIARALRETVLQSGSRSTLPA